MKKIIIILLSSFLFTSCQGAKDAFSLKKKNSTDEFLVEKKNPLVMPPDFDKLPLPENTEDLQNLSEEDSIESLIGANKKKSSEEKQSNSQSSSIEKLILDEIN